MPGMDGMDLLKTIKTLKPDTEVVIMTAFGTIERRSRPCVKVLILCN